MSGVHKILLVGYKDDSMEPAYDILSLLQHFGYSADICHVNTEDFDSKIKASHVLDPETSLSGYEGVVFLDDGGDPEYAASLAKKAIEKEIVIGGHGEGAVLLGKLGAFKDSYVCGGLPEELYEGATKVDAPSTRSGNLITSVDGCATGFAVLLVDALGGKVKNIIRSRGNVPSKSALIVAPLSHWSGYWGLAKEMSRRGTSVIVSDWEDLDIENGIAKSCAYLDVSAGDIKLMGKQSIPNSVWIRDPDMPPELISYAVSELEKSGRRTPNSYEALQKLYDKDVWNVIASATPCHQIKSYEDIDSVVSDIMRGGSFRVASLPGAPRRRETRIRGLGKYASVIDGKECPIYDRGDLKQAISKMFNRGGFVLGSSSDLPNIMGNKFNLCWVMNKSADGWRPRARLAYSGSLVCLAADVLRVVLPDEMADVMQDADAVAELVSSIIQSLTGSPDGLGEMSIVMVMNGGTPEVADISPFPDPAMEMSAGSVERIKALGARASKFGGMGPDFSDMTNMLSSNAKDTTKLRVLERELSNEKIWMQPDGSIAMEDMGEIQRFSDFKDLIEKLRQDAISAVQKEIDSTGTVNPVEQRFLSRASQRSRHRLRVSLEMWNEMPDGGVKTAGIYPSSVSGPYSHLELPMFERVFEWKDGDDYLEDRNKAVSDLPRYNPEYEKTSPLDETGVFGRWQEPNRDPTGWLDVLNGDGIYKFRKLR